MIPYQPAKEKTLNITESKKIIHSSPASTALWYENIYSSNSRVTKQIYKSVIIPLAGVIVLLGKPMYPLLHHIAAVWGYVYKLTYYY